MSIPVHCKTCGYTGIARSVYIENATEATFIGGGEDCPICGGLAEFQSGTYDFVGDVMTAFRAPGMTRQKVADFRAVLEQAKEGTISASAAVKRAENIDPLLSRLLRAAYENGITFDRVLAVLIAIHVFWTSYSSDAAVQSALAESRHQTELSQKMLSELQKQNASSSESRTKTTLQPPSPARTSAPKNRHERLKAAAVERRRNSRSSSE